MKSFYTTLVNGRRGDPALYVLLLETGNAFLFDMGTLNRCRIKNLHKVSHIFISHAHMDHFIGFDYFLRVMLGQKKTVHLFGPEGIVDKVHHRLQGYSWNLVQRKQLAFEVHEVVGEQLRSYRFQSFEGFEKRYPLGERGHQGVLYREGLYEVHFATLNHRIPSLAFSLVRRSYARIRKEVLTERQYPAGVWIRDLLAFAEGRGEDREVELGGKNFRLSELAEELVHFEEEEKIGYVVDTIYSPEVEEKVVNLVRGANVFFCEASFLRKDIKKARKTYHLCGFQAGEMARKAEVKKFIPFHFSWSYSGDVSDLVEEAMAAFRGDGDANKQAEELN